MKKYFWFALHNAIAHPLLLIPCRFTHWFHNYTADKM
jgi:hypothetical protein